MTDDHFTTNAKIKINVCRQFSTYAEIQTHINFT
jgi:hypothetical protein